MALSGDHNQIKRLTSIAILISCSLILYLVEAMIPVPLPVPGAKLGLANVVTLISIVLLRPYDALLVVAVRCLLGSLLSGNLASFWFSIAGSTLATIVMSIAFSRFNSYLSLAGISVLGGVFHNIGQLFVAAIMVQSFGIYFYLPFLIIAGVISGYLVGLIAQMTLRGLAKAGAWLGPVKIMGPARVEIAGKDPQGARSTGL
ncbi:MAG: Gx transporter family protein [Firmicutes bacterium]|nr:Gx transporter family protein [Bacillota bacterium]